MKAMRVPEFGPPEVLRLDEIEKPTPGYGEALVRVHAVGVNRMDVELRGGVYGKEALTDFYFGRLIEFPHTPGIEPAGVVEAVGEGVTEVNVGDRVVPHSHLSCGHCRHCRSGVDNACAQLRVLGVQTSGVGGYAEYFVWPARNLIPLPETVSFEEGASLLVNYGPVWFGLIERANLRPGETLLVTGASGGCGHAAIQVGKLVGARVIALGGSEEKLADLRARGADVAIDYRDGDFSAAVMEATGGEGADVVCELVGADTWTQSMASAALRGRLVVIGSHGGIRAELNLGELFGKNVQITGVTRANHATMAKLVRLAGEGLLRPAVWRTMPLAEAAEAHRLMEERRHSGKIVLTVT
ncbi:MAG: zinc-binding dehydrogenase [Microbispora sp.]|nr:zinc-binding dehydrogenase [Microbispora sp.]